MKLTRVPFALGVIPFWLLFWLGFIVWWALMSVLFRAGRYPEAVAVAYILPSVYSLAAYASSKIKVGYLSRSSHFISFVVIVAIYAALLPLIGSPLPAPDAAAYLGLAFIAAVMSIMQYPKAGWARYFEYRTPLFIAGVIFMPLFVYFAVMLPNVPAPPAIDKAILFPVGMVGFWASAAWLASSRTQGGHVPGLEVRPLMPFRPDYILPGGVNYVKGVIMMGVGLMIMIHDHLGMPKWNWWGFILAFWGIMTLIPLRGIYKLVKGRRRRMLGYPKAFGFEAEFYKGLILFVGLNILLYGFVNAFFGTIPFLELGVKPEFNALALNKPAGWFGLAMLVLSFIVIVLIRGWYKIRLLEGAEGIHQLVAKQALLYVGTLLLLIAYIHLLHLPPIRRLGFMWLYPTTNPIGFTVGLILFIAGSLLILLFRPLALRNELVATMRTMVGVIADSPESIRERVMRRRIVTLADMPEHQRLRHMRMMIDGLNRLPEDRRSMMFATQVRLLAELPSDKRAAMMRTLDRVLIFKEG